MFWPFNRSKNGVATPTEPTAEEVEAEEVEAEARKVRRDAAQKRIVNSMREAAEARETTMSMEAVHVKATDERHKKAETTIRQAQEKATEITDTICPLGAPRAEQAGA